MNIEFTKPAIKQAKNLSENLRIKATKQFKLFRQDIHHPSLHVKKMSGSNYYEGRIDYKYRFVFRFIGDTAYILSIGPHDEGLGKK